MELVLATLNARYPHASLGLRSLRANLGPLRERSVLREFTLSQRPLDIVEALLAESPKVIGLGVYIWNARESLEVLRLLRQLAPGVKRVLGGPEVSFELPGSEWLTLADHVITGEGEIAFARLAQALLELFLEYLVAQGHEREAAGLQLARDFSRPGQHVPVVLQPWVKTVNAELKKSLPPRQARHAS